MACLSSRSKAPVAGDRRVMSPEDLTPYICPYCGRSGETFEARYTSFSEVTLGAMFDICLCGAAYGFSEGPAS